MCKEADLVVRVDEKRIAVTEDDFVERSVVRGGLKLLNIAKAIMRIEMLCICTCNTNYYFYLFFFGQLLFHFHFYQHSFVYTCLLFIMLHFTRSRLHNYISSSSSPIIRHYSKPSPPIKQYLSFYKSNTIMPITTTTTGTIYSSNFNLSPHCSSISTASMISVNKQASHYITPTFHSFKANKSISDMKDNSSYHKHMANASTIKRWSSTAKVSFQRKMSSETLKEAKELWKSLLNGEYDITEHKKGKVVVKAIKLRKAKWFGSGKANNVLFVRKCDEDLYDIIKKNRGEGNASYEGMVITGNPGIGDLLTNCDLLMHTIESIKCGFSFREKLVFIILRISTFTREEHTTHYI